MKVGYVELYVNDAEAWRRFWMEQVGIVEKQRQEAAAFKSPWLASPISRSRSSSCHAR